MDSKEYENPEEGNCPKSTLVSRNVTVMGRRTSVRLEPEMWSALKQIARREYCTIHDLCTLISLRKREQTSLTAAIRVFLMLYFQASSTEEGHQKAGHGSFETMALRARLPENVFKVFSKKKPEQSRSTRLDEAMETFRDSQGGAPL